MENFKEAPRGRTRMIGGSVFTGVFGTEAIRKMIGHDEIFSTDLFIGLAGLAVAMWGYMAYSADSEK